MKKLFCLVTTAAMLLGFFSSCLENEVSVNSDVSIVCETSEASEITTNSATLNGDVSFSNAKAELADVWFLIGQYEGDLATEGNKISAGKVPTTGGPVSVSASNLEPETTYYYMLCTSIDGQKANGEVASFTTLHQEEKLTVVTLDAENVTETTAVLPGYFEGVQTEGLDFGVMYSTNENLERRNYLGSKELDSNNKYITTATDLIPAFTYYYQAYIGKDGCIISTGEIKSFTTSDFSVTVSTEEVSDIDYFSATLHGTLSVDSKDNLDRCVWFHYSDKYSTLKELTAGEEKYLDLAEDGSFSLSINSLKYNTTYYYVACTNVQCREYYGEVKSFTTTTEPPAGAVDLGLSVYWAATNIGADKPEDYGGYFAWGETETKDDYTWSTYKMCNKVPADVDGIPSFSKYVVNSGCGTVDDKKYLEPEDDVAHLRLGGYWRLPAVNEWDELENKCTWTWKQENGVNGMLVTSNINGASIFIPFAGYRAGKDTIEVGMSGNYWTLQIYGQLSQFAAIQFIRANSLPTYYTLYRYLGHSIRPVFGDYNSLGLNRK